MEMKYNIGRKDQIIRFVLGGAIIIAGIIWKNAIIGLIGLIPIITALAGWCPIYALFRMNTSSIKK